MKTNVYDIYRSVQQKRNTCNDNRSAAFILEGKISQNIFHKRLNKDIPAALVFNHKEGPDDAITYTLIEDDLVKTDYFVYDDVNYLVYEDVKLTDKDINYKKQRAVECNVAFTYEGESHYGYFTSSVRRTNDPDFEGRQGFIPNENPLLILPSSTSIDIKSTFNIEDKPWKVVEYDHITNKGISYIYLERHFSSTVSPEEEETIEVNYVDDSEEITQEDDGMQIQTLGEESSAAEEPSLRPMVEYTFSTEQGYFASTPRVDLLTRTISQVKFRIPYGVSEVSVSTKKDGQIVEKNYKVVM